jgi:hypothetical protein
VGGAGVFVLGSHSDVSQTTEELIIDAYAGSKQKQKKIIK